MRRERKLWLLYGFLGAVFFGMGLSICIEAGFWKHDGSHWAWWVFGGVMGLSSAVFGAFCMVKAGGLAERMRIKDEESSRER